MDRSLKGLLRAVLFAAGLAFLNSCVSDTPTLPTVIVSLATIAITPATPSVAAGALVQLGAVGTNSDGSKVDLTKDVTFASDNAAVATITNAATDPALAGFAQGVAVGTAHIAAAYQGLTAPAVPLLVTPADATGTCAPSPTLALWTHSFLSNWQLASSNGGWKQVQAVAGGLAASPTVVNSHGAVVAHVVVRPGDDPLGLGKGTERAEVAIMQDAATGALVNETEASGTVFYGFSYLFPVGYKASAITDKAISDWSIVLQLHSPDAFGFSPSIALQAGRTTATGAPQFFLTGESGGPIPAGTFPAANAYKFALNGADANVPLGTWVDFMMRVNFSSTSAGSIALWRRDAGQPCFHQALNVSNIPTLAYTTTAPVGPHYWKQGLYRNGQAWTDELWMGPLARGPSFGAVEAAAFQTNSTGAK